ncbi:MAG: hypothetical protein A2987_01780 [Omnitrophica bacterium RIFCSPLOWO2_01_FULL_45_10]|nr:MAG: hypothetical protein A2987_01780 [Omnitrophica bacterium RIFCSPLOWO2_01_FULL_45_10]
MKVLLINPLCRLPFSLPLGLGYIASVLRQNGHDVSMLDINGSGYCDDKVEEMLKSYEFDIVGIGGLTSTYRYVKWLARVIKNLKPGIPIAAGNMVSTAHPELLLANTDVDIAVIDEGELTVTELVSAIEETRDIEGVAGIFFKRDGKVIRTSPRKRITDLDSLPFPAWNLFPMEVYINNSTQSHVSFGLRSINISTVRGCPYDCTFCSHPFGRTTYARSARSIVDEIKELKRLYGIQFIDFSDDLFLFNERRVLKLCDAMTSNNLKIKWSASARVNLVNEKLLTNMHKAGCQELSYGFESGSQSILDKIRKRVTVTQALDAVEMTRKAKIKVIGSFIFGMPGENNETIKETLDFIKRTHLPVHRFFYATPYPGTELYSIAKEMHRLPDDEDNYMQSLGEMRTTFLVNLTDFSDEELVKLKESSEKSAYANFDLKIKLEHFLEDWHRRFLIVSQSLKRLGIGPTIRMLISKIMLKLKKWIKIERLAAHD